METTINDQDRQLMAELLTELRKYNARSEVVLSVQQAAKIIGRSRQTISRKIREGKLHKVERGGVIGILESELTRSDAVEPQCPF